MEGVGALEGTGARGQHLLTRTPATSAAQAAHIGRFTEGFHEICREMPPSANRQTARNDKQIVGDVHKDAASRAKPCGGGQHLSIDYE